MKKMSPMWREVALTDVKNMLLVEHEVLFTYVSSFFS